MPLPSRRHLFFDLSGRTKLRITGSDRLRYINGQITNDIRKAGETSAIAACVLNAKGKINAFVFLSAQSDHVLLDTDAECRDTLHARLNRYVISDDVEIEDVSAQFSVFHVLGELGSGFAGRVISAKRFGQLGFDVWTDAAQHQETQKIVGADSTFCDGQCADTFRIEQGIPRWGNELNEEVIPVEANLESISIDYGKGCYIGQEVISRMRMSGQRNKALYGVVAAGERELVPGMKLFSSECPRKEAGWITSATWSNRFGKHIGLGYLKRPFNRPGAAVEAQADSNQPVYVQIVDLPFVSAGC